VIAWEGFLAVARGSKLKVPAGTHLVPPRFSFPLGEPTHVLGSGKDTVELCGAWLERLRIRIHSNGGKVQGEEVMRNEYMQTATGECGGGPGGGPSRSREQ